MFEDEEYFDDNYFQNFDEEYLYDSNFGFRSYSCSEEDFEDAHDFFTFDEDDFDRSHPEPFWEDHLDCEFDNLDDWNF
jgi:hypothetical protein